MNGIIEARCTGGLAAAVAVGLTLALPSAAGAVDDLPFTISAQTHGSIACIGPGVPGIVPRYSGCQPFRSGSRQRFYAADANFISPYGNWACEVRLSCQDYDTSPTPKAETRFCLNYSNGVDLVWDGAGSLTSNQPPICSTTLTKSVLGQTGEADDTPARDVDTYLFAGRAGERIAVTLGRDGSSGSLGAVATLRLRAQGGAVLRERTGEVPLELEATLPGEIEVVVLRDGKAGNALRGGYEIDLRPVSGALDGRILRPTENVEG